MKNVSLLQIVLLFFLFFSNHSIEAQNLLLEKDWPTTNGIVRVIETDEVNGLIYLGGSFNYIGPNTPYGVAAKTSTGNTYTDYDCPNGPVHVAIPDGSGGWFIGGEFTKVGNIDRNKIAHIDSNGKLTDKFSGFGFNDAVKALKIEGDNLYVGGAFNSAGKIIKYGAQFIDSNSFPDFSYPQPNGSVRSSVSDGNGGWFISGNFTMVGDSIRNKLAHIDNNGIVTSFNPGMSGSAAVMVVNNGKLFLGGGFSDVAGEPRTGLASIDISTGLITSWSPSVMMSTEVSGRVFSMASDDTAIYVGGNFLYINGVFCRHLAKIDINTGNLITFPDISSTVAYVFALERNGSSLFVGGSFNNISGVSRSNIGSINLDNNTVTAWNPNPDNTVYAIRVYNNIAYVGGNFTNIGGQPRSYLSAIDISTSMATSWNPNPNNGVNKLVIYDNSVIVTGGFSTIGGESRRYIASVDLSIGLSNQWNPHFDKGVLTVSIFNNKIYTGGDFVSLGGEYSRSYVAAVNKNSGTISNWAPEINDEVWAIETAGDVVYVGGKFSTVNGTSRNGLASINAIDASVTSWKPDAGMITLLKIADNILYAGGGFTSIFGEGRNCLASVDISTGNLTSWNPNVNNGVKSLDIADGVVYIGGEFTSVGGQARSRLAAVSLATADLLPWNPNSMSVVNSLIIVGDSVIVGGAFNSIGGQPRNYLASIDKSTGNLNAWNPSPNGAVRTIALQNSELYIGGDFNMISGVARRGVAAINKETKEVTSWNPNVNADVSAIVIDGNEVFLGGSFTAIGGQSRNLIGSVDAITGNVLSWNPNLSGIMPTNYISAIAKDGNTVYVGGEFRFVGSDARLQIAAIDATTGLATSWNPGASGRVADLIVNGSNIFVAGTFITIGGQTRERIAELSLATGLPTAWNPTAQSYVYDIELDAGTVYAGGVFNSIGGQPYKNAAAINATTGNALNWNPNPNSYVYAVVKNGNKIILGGNFSSLGNKSALALGEVDVTTAEASSWNPGIKKDEFTANIYAVNVFDDLILSGGDFNEVEGEYRAGFAVFSMQCNLVYKSGGNGIVSGNTNQYVKPGNSGSSVEAIPDPGYHFVKWSDDVTNNPRTDTNVTTDIDVTAIFERTPPVADFTTDITFGEMPVVVQFTDLSLNIPESWSWDFGDGNFSSEQNPVHEYTVPGLYTVSLTVTNSATSDTHTKTDYITARICNNAMITQHDWSGGPGQTLPLNDSTMFETFANIDFNSVPGQISASFVTSESDYATFFFNGKMYNGRSYGLMTLDTIANEWNYEVKILGLNNAKVTIMNDTLYVLSGWNIFYTDGTTDDYGMGNNGWRLHSVFPSTNLQGAYSLGSFQNHLYVGVRNNSSQGSVRRYNGTSWMQVGGIIEVAPMSFFVYNNEFFVGTHWYGNIYKKSASDTWQFQYSPASSMYVSDFIEFQGNLYAAVVRNTYHEGRIVKFDGSAWSTTYIGLGCYSLAVADNIMYVSTQNSTSGSGQILQTTNGTTYTTAYTLTANETRAVLTSDGEKLYHGTVKKGGTFSSNFYIGGAVAFNYLNASLKSSQYNIQAPAVLTGIYDADIPAGTGFAVLTQGKKDGVAWDVDRYYKPLPNGNSRLFDDEMYRYEVVMWSNNPATTSIIYDLSLAQLAEVNTAEVTLIEYFSADSGGEIDIYCSTAVKQKGIIWSTSQYPTIDNYIGITNEGEGSDSFVSQLTGLNHNTQYYVRAYATTNFGTSYGQQKLFKTLTLAPIADFEANQTTGVAPLELNFSDMSLNDPDSWSWDFGDTNTSSQRNPQNTYIWQGTYSVSLVVSNIGGNDTKNKISYISVIKPDVISGDDNNDGFVNVLDIVWLVDYLNGSINEGFNIYAADINESLSIELSDLTLLIQSIMLGVN